MRSILFAVVLRRAAVISHWIRFFCWYGSQSHIKHCCCCCCACIFGNRISIIVWLASCITLPLMTLPPRVGSRDLFTTPTDSGTPTPTVQADIDVFGAWQWHPKTLKRTYNTTNQTFLMKPWYNNSSAADEQRPPAPFGSWYWRIHHARGIEPPS